MKDIVGNRRRVSWLNKVRTAFIALRENGPIWCSYLFAYYLSSTIAEHAHAQMHRRRRDRKLPGLNSAALNQHIWNSWDWSAQGDEWSSSEEWKQSLISSVLRPNMPRGGDILEIGPGGGRWTETLVELARGYVGVDISASCIEHCKKRFGDASHARFFVGSGRDLADVATASVDAIWSFDVFVHVNAAEVAGYVREFDRVLRPGGIAVIHHGGVAGTEGGWRSDLTAAAFESMVTSQALRIQQTVLQWTDGPRIHELTFGDHITVIAKPARTSAPGI